MCIKMKNIYHNVNKNFPLFSGIMGDFFISLAFYHLFKISVINMYDFSNQHKKTKQNIFWSTSIGNLH